MAFYAGLDLGAKTCHVCVVDEQDKPHLKACLPNRLETILERLQPFRVQGLSCVVESTFNWYWLADGLQEAGYPVCLAHTAALHAITRAKVKTDRRDAFRLAQLLRADLIPKAYIYPRDQRPVRDLVRARLRAVAARAQSYGALRRMLYQEGLLEHDRNRIKEVDEADLERWFTHPLVRLRGRHEVDRIEFYTGQIVELEAEIAEQAESRAEYARLMALPGVGPVLARTILYEAGEVVRFRDAREFSSYCRVVRGVAQSGATVGKGRAPKQGNPYLKCALTEAATFARRYCPKARRFYERCLARHAGPGRVMIANNALAHKLAQAVYFILARGACYQEKLLFGA